MATDKLKKITPDELRRSVAEIGREVSARTILMHQAIAEKVGVSVTELKCLDYVSRGTPVTAGRLAEITGLTTGAVTAMVDRLERAGLVRRERSADDRRKVFIQPAEDTFGSLFDEIYGPLSQAAAELAGQYSEPELKLIYEYTLKSIQMVREQTERIRALKVGKAAAK
jgi:DNA-binding MarR family transcriptional regulator